METRMKYFLVLVLLKILAGQCFSKKITMYSYEDRRKCSYWQQSGCFLMSLQFFCELPASELVKELKNNIKMLERCCCPKPFKKCRDIDENQVCRKYYEEMLLDETSPVSSRKEFVHRVNQIRSKMFEHDQNCTEYLAPVEPFRCDSHQTPEFYRQDLRCELLAWQYEELGIVEKQDFDLNSCPFVEENKGSSTQERFVNPKELADGMNNDEEGSDALEPQSYSIESYNDRRKCRYWQQSGCFLDIMEKACEIDSGRKKRLAEFFSGDENVFLCCCPTPYKACKQSEADLVCLELLDRAFNTEKIERLKSIERDVLVNGLQQLRKDLMLPHKHCEMYLAPFEPFAKCSKRLPPFSRHDLKCELITWQWEELGDGNKPEFDAINCPFVEKSKGKDGDSRKGFSQFLPEDKQEL